MARSARLVDAAAAVFLPMLVLHGYGDSPHSPRALSADVCLHPDGVLCRAAA
jgi:hypothetical protein